jgi:hypothetical protein
VRHDPQAALKAFRMLLRRKDIVSYLDELVDTSQAADLLQKLEVFARWSRKTFEDLRRRNAAP